MWLAAGYFFIRRKAVRAHAACMTGACATSAIFLACYLYYHAHHGATRFPGTGAARAIYLAILVSHSILAVAVVPLAIASLILGWRGLFPKHVRVARVTFPIWMYVSVTGVIVYWMLYRLYA